MVGTFADAADIIDDANFGLALENEVAVSRVGVSDSTAKPKVDYLNLSKNWGISPEIAKKNYKLLLSVVLGMFCIRLYLKYLGQMTELYGIVGCNKICLEIH